MEKIIEWLTTYSPGVALLLILGAALVYILQLVVEKTISAGFTRQERQLELKLEKRSNFEERVLLDRYTMVRDLYSRIGREMSNVNRHNHGMTVEGLTVDGELVALTEVFELLESNRFLLTKRFHHILYSQAGIVLKFGNARTPEAIQKSKEDYLALSHEFHAAMNEMFGLDEIA